MRDYDVVHFNFGQSTLPQRIPIDAEGGYRTLPKRLRNVFVSLLELNDLKLLKRMGKGIVMTYQGDDARQGDVLRTRFKISPADEAGYYTREFDSLNRQRIKKVVCTLRYCRRQPGASKLAFSSGGGSCTKP
jgi:hypothetical protein